MLALGLVQLINPRLYEYDYDLYLLYPAMALVVMVAKDLNVRVFAWLQGLFITVMICDFLISLIGINILPYFPGTFLTLCALFLTVVGLSLKHQTPFFRLSDLPVLRKVGFQSQFQPPRADKPFSENNMP
ncbi:hypothetical protein [Asticcacaulis sp. AC466]|uniref:hypothetical protein n=1 Tax=Asticcacaulis sp. AC466 TaxID=1282362 RepID=UPI0012DC375F|nr:hypothetical protein [Asticcacaulis sp. AC466]